MDLDLGRYSYATSETEGVLSIGDFSMATIERPWIAHSFPGGKPFESCVPDGEYRLDPWTRPDGTKVYILSNEDLGVYRGFAERPNGKGRYLILIHIGNWVTDIVGCIAPGMSRSLTNNKKTGRVERSVSSSGEAMRIIREQLGTESHKLTIRSVCGTSGEKG